MRVVKFVILAIVAVVLVMIAMANAQAVTLRVIPEAMAGFLGFSWTVTLPMFVVVLVSVMVGLLVGFVVEYSREHKHRAAARAERRERQSLEREVKKHRSPASSPRKGDDILALLDDGSANNNQPRLT